MTYGNIALHALGHECLGLPQRSVFEIIQADGELERQVALAKDRGLRAVHRIWWQYRAVVEAAMTRDGRDLKLVEGSFRTDLAIVGMAVRSNKEALRWAPTAFARLQMENDKSLLEFAPEELQDDKEMVMAAVGQDGELLKHASSYLQDDMEVVDHAMRQNIKAFQFASEAIKNDKAVVMAAIEQNAKLLQYASIHKRDDMELVMEAVKKDGMVIQYASDKCKDNREVVKIALESNPLALQFVSIRKRDDVEIVLEAVKKDGKAIQYASDRCKDNEAVKIAHASNL